MRRTAIFAFALLPFTALAQSPPPQPEAPPANPATLEGKVATLTGQPVRKANLTLRRNGQPPQTTYSATSEADGSFQFTGIPAGQYSLLAERAGNAPQAYGARPGYSYITGPRAIITVKAGDKLTGRDIQMQPATTLSGRVLDEDGDPLERVQVRAIRFTDVGGPKMQIMAGVTTTDQNGEFRFSNLQPDRYVLQAEIVASFQGDPAKRPPRKPGEEELAYVTTYYPGTTDPRSASNIEVPAGRDLPAMDIPLRKSAVHHIRGQVNGIPASNNLRVLAPDPGALYLTSWAGGASVHEDGTFDLASLPTGTHALVVLDQTTGGTILARRIVTIGHDDLADIVLTGLPDLSLKGRIQVEPNPAPPNPKDPPKPPQFRIFFRPLEGIQTGGQANISVDADGNFSVPRFNPGKYLVTVNGEPDGTYWKSTSRGKTELPENILSIESQDSSPLEILFARNGATVDATVPPAETPSHGSDFCTLIADGEGPGALSLFKSNRIQPDGHCILKGLRPGSYRLFAIEDNSFTGSMSLSEIRSLLGARGVPVSVQEKDSVKMTAPLVKAGEIERLFANR